MEIKLIEALIISGLLSLLMFRINYDSNPKISKAKYTNKIEDKIVYNYSLLIIDLITAMLFALIGCYLSWNIISTIPDLKVYLDWIFPASILTGIMFQQILPIIIELAMNKINSFKPTNSNK